MNFKELVKQDLEHILFNTEELAELHELNGYQVPVILDNSKLLHFKQDTGLMDARILIFVQSSKLKFTPEAGNVVQFDGRKYEILSSEKYGGAFEIVLGAKKK